MAAFHTSWFGFFASFYSTFAASALNAYIVPADTGLGLTAKEIGYSNDAAVGGTIFFRLVMGVICDKFGARKGLGFLLLGTMPAIVLMMFAQNAWQYILLRCCIGFGLATFVACQTWCAQMFAKKVVGIANATAAGWGNLGGGITNLTMPYVFLIFASFVDNDYSVAWRISYLVPLAFHLCGGLMVLTARDLPDGNFKELETVGAKQKSNVSTVLKVGCSNINAIIFTLTYGMCFGIELTMNNVANRYFYTYHGLNPQVSGLCASAWGLMNIICRSIGGWISDWSNDKAGMRGRLWSCWAVQTIEGVFCIILGLTTINMDAPHSSSVGGNDIAAWVWIDDDPIRAQLGLPNGWTDINATCHDSGTAVPLTIKACGTLITKIPKGDAIKDCLKITGDKLLRKTAPLSAGGPDLNCISNNDAVGMVMLLVVLFSFCVQAAEGLHYGIVPYISRPALGVVSGMVGAGGNLGAVIAGRSFFTGEIRTDLGIIYMGIMIIAITFLINFMYFPEHGGMWVKAGGLGGYDPQIIKPPEGYRGSDSMDFEAAKRKQAEQAEGVEVEVSKA